MVTRDEFMYRQLEEGRSLYTGLAVVIGLCSAAGFVMALFAYGRAGIMGVLYCLIIGFGFAASARVSWAEREAYDSALEEIGSDPSGVDTCRTYSQKTARLIARSRMAAKTFLQQGIAYGIIALMLLGFGVFMTVMAVCEFNDDLLFPGLALLLFAGGAILTVLTIGSFRNWRDAKYLESLP